MTFETCVPRLLWTPEHFRHMNTPMLADLQVQRKLSCKESSSQQIKDVGIRLTTNYTQHWGSAELPKKMTTRLILILRYMSRCYFISSLDMGGRTSNLKSRVLTPIWDQVHCSQHICGYRSCAATLWASSSYLNWGEETWAFGIYTWDFGG
jgi:hypothetical protein